MTSTELKEQIVNDVVAHGFTLPAKVLDLNLQSLIHLARLEALTEARIGILDQHITEPIDAVTDPQL